MVLAFIVGATIATAVVQVALAQDTGDRATGATGG
jgi:hypothetical protein